MRFSKIFSLLIVGFSITSALPLQPTTQALDENDAKLVRRTKSPPGSPRSSGRKSSSPPAANSRPESPSGGGALYVEMGEAAWLDATGTKYTVLATEEGPARPAGLVENVTAKKQPPQVLGIWTDRLATCVAVVITTPSGTVFVHVPGYLAEYVAGTRQLPPAKLEELAALKNAVATVLQNLPLNRKTWEAFAAYGPYGDKTGAQIPYVMKAFFGLERAKCVNCRELGTNTPKAHDRTVRVDLTTKPPTFYVDGYKLDQ